MRVTIGVTTGGFAWIHVADLLRSRLVCVGTGQRDAALSLSSNGSNSMPPHWRVRELAQVPGNRMWV